MEKSNLAPIVLQLCDLQLQHFQLTQELLIQIAAIHEVIKDRGDKGFQSDLQKKTLLLKQGELGKKTAQDTEIFQQGLGRIRSRVL